MNIHDVYEQAKQLFQ